MVRGMSHCRICGKPIPSGYRKRHEHLLCLKMRFERGDSDVVARFPNGLPKRGKVKKDSVPLECGQRQLFEPAGLVEGL